MNFKDYLPVIAMMIPSALMIVAAIVTLVLAANAPLSTPEAQTPARPDPSYAATKLRDAPTTAKDSSGQQQRAAVE